MGHLEPTFHVESPGATPKCLPRLIFASKLMVVEHWWLTLYLCYFCVSHNNLHHINGVATVGQVGTKNLCKHSNFARTLLVLTAQCATAPHVEIAESMLFTISILPVVDS